MRHQQFVDRRRRLDDIRRNVRAKDGLRPVAGLEMAGVAQLVRQREHVRHLVVPGQQNIGMRAVGA